jgi:glycosyltransferase involved in cell wall biosynthesis
VTVGFYSPLPPARTGVADYAAALLAELRRHGRVEAAPRRCDVALYHLGNNALHAGIYRRALERPGVVVLHDAVLHHFLLGQLDESAYIEEFVYNYGEWHRALAGELWRGRAASASESRYFEFPMLRRVVERALAVVVHNPEAAGMVGRAAWSADGALAGLRPEADGGVGRGRTHKGGGYPGPPHIEIPHLFAPPAALPSESAAARYRQRLGVDPGAFLFGVFGHLRESKRLIPVLETFAELRRENPRVALLVAGGFISAELERAAAPLLDSPGVVRRPYLAESEFWLAASAVDACINLRDPSAGETSGIAIRLMGLGKPVALTDSAAIARFPEDACVRIAPGAAERESLRQSVRLLTLAHGAAVAIGQRGARHIHERHRVELAGARYWELLCECCA